ncbi:DUF2190 family protein [Variovorax paradoxus]|uniref:DUF2190 family protein n=1 Tax=Variovorax paradoxus TaxID=34073 RepID=UPI003ECCAE0B
MKNFIQVGDVLDHMATANVASGELVVIGARVGIAMSDMAVGESGAVRVKGVFELPKAAAAIEQGAEVYWDAVNKRLTTVATDNVRAGYAAGPAGNGASTVWLHVNA